MSSLLLFSKPVFINNLLNDEREYYTFYGEIRGDRKSVLSVITKRIECKGYAPYHYYNPHPHTIWFH